jgi:hypothetical protein
MWLPRHRAARSTRGAQSFDHLVGEREQRWRNFDAECLCGGEIDDQLRERGIDLIASRQSRLLH